MRVSDLNIENSWKEITSGSTALVERFYEEEPILADFLAEAMGALSSDASDLGYFSALVVWRAFDLVEKRSEPVSAEKISGAYRTARDWFQAEESILLEKKIRDFRTLSEPHLMKYVVEAVLDSHEDGFDLDPSEEERLLVCLKAIVDALT